MSDKKENVLTRFFGVFRQKKLPGEDIVAMADKVIEEYIFEKNKLIHRRTSTVKKSSGMFPFVILSSSLAAAFVLFKIII